MKFIIILSLLLSGLSLYIILPAIDPSSDPPWIELDGRDDWFRHHEAGLDRLLMEAEIKDLRIHNICERIPNKTWDMYYQLGCRSWYVEEKQRHGDAYGKGENTTVTLDEMRFLCREVIRPQLESGNLSADTVADTVPFCLEE